MRAVWCRGLRIGFGGEGEIPSSRGPQRRKSFCRTCCSSRGFSWRLYNQRMKGTEERRRGGTNFSAEICKRCSASSSATMTGRVSPWQSSKSNINSHLYGTSSPSAFGGMLHLGQSGEEPIRQLYVKEI